MDGMRPRRVRDRLRHVTGIAAGNTRDVIVTGTPFRSGDLGIGSSGSGTSGIRLDWR